METVYLGLDLCRGNSIIFSARLFLPFQYAAEFIEKGRVQCPDRHRKALHDLEETDKIFFCMGSSFLRAATVRFVIGDDDLTHRHRSGRLRKTCVLSGKENDTFSAERHGNTC